MVIIYGCPRKLIEWFLKIGFVATIYFFIFYFCWSRCTVGRGARHAGILVPHPGIEPMPPVLEAQSPNHWTTREVPLAVFLIYLTLYDYF